MKTLPCVAVFMSSLTIVSIAVDRYRIIVHSTARQVRCSRNIIAGIRSFSKLELLYLNVLVSIPYKTLYYGRPSDPLMAIRKLTISKIGYY